MKKKVVTAATIVLLIFSATAHAQLGIRTGLKAGKTWSHLGGDQGLDNKLEAYSAGFSMELNLMVISFQADLLYTKKGGVIMDAEGPEDFTLTCLSVPCLAKLSFFPLVVHPYVVAGLEFNILLSADRDGNDVKDQLSTQTLAAVVGCGVEFSVLGKGAYVEARYSYGLKSIYTEGDTAVKNRSAQVFLGVLF